MTDSTPSPPANNVNNGPPPPSIASSIVRGIMMYMFMNTMQRFAIQQGYIPDPNPAAAKNSATSQDMHMNTKTPMKPQGAGNKMPQRRPRNIWKLDTLLDLHVYITDSDEFDPLINCIPDTAVVSENSYGEWHQTGLELTTLDHAVNYRTDNITVPISKNVQYNETQIYAHVCLIKQDYSLDNTDENDNDSSSQKGERKLSKDSVLHKTFLMTKYKKRKKKRDEKNLLATENATDAAIVISEDASPLTKASANIMEDATLLYLKPSLTLQMIDFNGMPVLSDRSKIPEQIGKHMVWQNETSTLHYPIIYQSEFWITSDALVEVNDTIKEIEVQITFENVKVWKWQLMSQMEETWRRQAETTGEDDASNDMFRTMLLETNPILLAVTAIVSVLHTVFDMLAFSNDIKFFKNKKSMHGLSLRSMIVNTLFQVVILLYLFDNDTSFMVLMSNGIGVAIEAWKISKAIKVNLFDNEGKISFSWKETETYAASATKEYDEIATSHLMFITMPLVCGYGIYSLFHQKHKGWYSWILNTLVGFIYMFGFVMMTPQLFINYKLQSVAHLNWRTMTYKSINTFIDDLFAFVIKMPVMHRLACLRDDAIFLIFCYQRYKYRTDYSRVNEYGQCEEPTEEMMIKETIKEQNMKETIQNHNDCSEIDNTEVQSEIVTKKRRGARDKNKRS